MFLLFLNTAVSGDLRHKYSGFEPKFFSANPNITLRFEAKTKERLEELQKEFETRIREYNEE